MTPPPKTTIRQGAFLLLVSPLLFFVGGAQPADWKNPGLSSLARMVMLFDGRDAEAAETTREATKPMIRTTENQRSASKFGPNLVRLVVDDFETEREIARVLGQGRALRRECHWGIRRRRRSALQMPLACGHPTRNSQTPGAPHRQPSSFPPCRVPDRQRQAWCGP